MSAYVYIWDPEARKWLFADMQDTEAEARSLGRDLWRSGVAGVKIQVVQTVVEEIRNR